MLAVIGAMSYCVIGCTFGCLAAGEYWKGCRMSEVEYKPWKAWVSGIAVFIAWPLWIVGGLIACAYHNRP